MFLGHATSGRGQGEGLLVFSQHPPSVCLPPVNGIHSCRWRPPSWAGGTLQLCHWSRAALGGWEAQRGLLGSRLGGARCKPVCGWPCEWTPELWLQQLHSVRPGLARGVVRHVVFG